MAAAPVGGAIRIRAGTYPEEVVIGKKLTLQPYGDGAVILDGACTRNTGINISAAAASGSTIQGLVIRRNVDTAVTIENTTVRNITIDGNTIQDFDCKGQGPEYRAGIASWNGGSGIRITNNTIQRRTSGSLTGATSDCIWFKSNTASPSGGGHYIAGNTLVGCWDGIGGETEDDPRGSFDRNTTIENNTITDCEDDGIQVEGGNANTIVRNNTIRRCSVGIANAPNLTGPLTIEGNTITEGRLGSYGNLACFKVGDNGTAVTNYTNNTCILTATGSVGWSQTNPGNNRIVARGNQINVRDYTMEFSSGLPSGTSFDADCLFSAAVGRFAKWAGTVYGSINSFRNATGQEASGTSSSSCGS